MINLLPFICRHHQQQQPQQPPNWWQQPHSDDNEDSSSNEIASFVPAAARSSSNGKRSRIEPVASASSMEAAPRSSHNEAVWPHHHHHSSSSRTRIRVCSSPQLPDEELTSVLQNFLDESRSRSGHKMEASMTASNEYNYAYHTDSYYNQTFLPNVSPSASSLDSGYCGPASVQSSIGM